MNDAEIKRLVHECVAGDILPERHLRLQEELKTNPRARAAFREVLDVEACLRTWASETPSNVDPPSSLTGGPIGAQRILSYSVAVVVASIVLASLSWWVWQVQFGSTQSIVKKHAGATVDRVVFVGTFGKQQNSVWNSPGNAKSGDRFAGKRLSLASGVAELKLDSGTNLMLQGPCELDVVAVDAAHLTGGNVVVHVTELSDGFTLQTPDAVIIDEGTEYAVSLDDNATEIHVFDGSVIWSPVNGGAAASTDRIESGDARRYLRSKPFGGARIPLGDRLFVRQIEATVRDNAGEALVAYDGFENLAGRMQRGRSGFGWSEGWRSGRRGRGRNGEIVDAPDDVVFGEPRAGRRLLQLAGGDAIVREFEQPLSLEPGDAYYASFLLMRSAQDQSMTEPLGRFFQLALYDGGDYRGHRSRRSFTFGITSAGLPFVKSVGSIVSTASPIESNATYLCVSKVLVTDEKQAATFLRIYRPTEPVERQEPTAWTTVGSMGPCDFSLTGVRLSVGADAGFDVDELKVGTSWQSVTASADERTPPAAPSSRRQ